jgi:glyoxylase I family protein
MTLDIRGLAPLLQVFDMPASLRFYRDLLGFEVAARSPPIAEAASEDDCHWVLLRLHGVELMLNTAYDTGERPPVPDPARVAAHADTGLYFGAPEVDAIYAELQAKGLDVKAPRVQRYGMKQLYLSDPDGYGLCFQWPV